MKSENSPTIFEFRPRRKTVRFIRIVVYTRGYLVDNETERLCGNILIVLYTRYIIKRVPTIL